MRIGFLRTLIAVSFAAVLVVFITFNTSTEIRNDSASASPPVTRTSRPIAAVIPSAVSTTAAIVDVVPPPLSTPPSAVPRGPRVVQPGTLSAAQGTAMIKAVLGARVTAEQAAAYEQEWCQRNHTVESLLAEARSDPTVDIDPDCRPAPLNTNVEELCGEHLHRPRARPARVIDITTFVSEVDLLELRLWELDESVDEFVIVEGIRDHHGFPNVPFLAELMKTPRFARFAHKVKPKVYEGGVSQAANTGSIRWEHEHAKQNWTVEIARSYGPHDVIVFSHLDEIPTRTEVWRAKHCDVPMPLNVAVWFPYGHVDHTMEEPFPYSFGVGHHPWISHPKDVQGLLPARRNNDRYLLGGFHASNYCFPPYILLKYATATESRLNAGREVPARWRQWLKDHPNDCFAELFKECRTGHRGTKRLEDRRPPIDKRILRLPWLIQCNPARQPWWFGVPDGRRLSNR